MQSYDSEGGFIGKFNRRTTDKVGNGTIEDIREIRSDVKKIATDGCAHKPGHDKSIDDLWTALGNEKTAREGLFVKIVLMVLAIVFGAMVANVYSTSAVVERVLSKALISQAVVVPPKR